MWCGLFIDGCWVLAFLGLTGVGGWCLVLGCWLMVVACSLFVVVFVDC